MTLIRFFNSRKTICRRVIATGLNDQKLHHWEPVMTTMSIKYFFEPPWWPDMANYKSCTNATAADARVKLISIKSPWRWCMVVYDSFTDATTKLDILITRHDDCACQTIQVIPTPLQLPRRQKWKYRWTAKMTTLRILDLCFRAATPDASTKLLQKERNLSWRERQDIVECWDCTGTLLTRMQPCFNCHAHHKGEL